MNLSLQDIKKEADKLIGQRVSFYLLSKEKGLFESFSEIVASNKVLEDKNICLTYFKDTNFCISSSNVLEANLFSIIKETEKGETIS